MRLGKSVAMTAALCLASAALVTPSYAQSSIRRKTEEKKAEIPTCSHRIGTLAIHEPDNRWWEGLGLESPEALLKIFVQRSGCFTLVDRGKGFEMAQQERALAAGDALQGGANIGGGQVRAADYILVPDIVSKNGNSGGTNIGGLLGGFIGGGVGMLVSGISINSKTADVVLSITNVRTSEQVAMEEGHGSKTDVGFSLGGAGGGFGGFGAAPQKGGDLRLKLDIDLLDTIVGNTRRVLLSDGRTVDVNIPKGAKDGQTLRLKGQGAPSPNGRGPHGDALVELHLKPHPVFRLEGHDLHMDLYVSLPDAVLGGKVQAPTPDGPVSLSIAKGTNSGAIMRLKGRGAYDGKGAARGDLFAHVVIALPDKADGVPTDIQADLTALAEKWRGKGGYTPSRRK
ncbi:MAG TPA: J domain-containing protein [Asticcacaulis sp.]